MAPPAVITFLGTSSAVPSQSRNHSSLCLTLPSGATYLFDAGEATQHQLQKIAGGFKNSSIKKVFITHMHGDHMFGLVPLLSTLMNGAGGTVGTEDPRKTGAQEVLDGIKSHTVEPFIEIYGPHGLREYVRTSLRLTKTFLGAPYVVHELHFSSGDLSKEVEKAGIQDNLAPMELPGKDIYQDEKGCWLDILTQANSYDREWKISAGPIKHSIECVGYVLTEPPLPGKFTPDYRTRLLANAAALKANGVKNPMALLSEISNLPDGGSIDLPDGTKMEKPAAKTGRKITILGDTYDPSGIAELAMGSDVLIHEATNSFLPKELNKDWKESETYDDVEKKTIEHGHSTPEMAAAFSSKIGLGTRGGVLGRVITEGKASKKNQAGEGKGVLLLNHFSSRYADPRTTDLAGQVMEEIRSCATRRYFEIQSKSDGTPGGTGAQTLSKSVDVLCAYDLMQYEIRAQD